MRKRVSLLILLISVLTQVPANGNNKNSFHQTNLFSMETLADTTLHEGVAGSFFGRQGDWFIMAGGSSFPDGKPWEKGIKRLSDKIFIFSRQADDTFRMIHEGNNLPLPLAEGAYASIPGGLLCMGGLTPEGIIAECRLLSFDGSRVTVTPFPPLPLPVKNATATLVGSRVYLLGGELADGTSSDQFLALDSDNPQAGWQPLPHFPLAVSGSTITAQQDGEEISLYVFGGRAKTNNEATTFYSTVYHYRPSRGSWSQKRDIRLKDEEPLPLAMATASSVGGSHILLYGGDNGEVFNRVEAAIHSGELQVRDSLWMNHPGFNRRILVYNTITDSWFQAGETTNPPVAVTADVSDGSNVYI
ncbi:MAG: hypothetical protein PHT65_12080, partial [Proteiniphilum sp.]|nr:hypothetical protein [Proteiniphilum sp.]